MRTLKPEEIEVRIGKCNEKCVTLLLYKTARTDMTLLDETFGPERWQCDYKTIDGKLYCGIGVKFDSEWVWKWDTGTESNMEAQKGEASDAFKRAGFKWGIGRELYTTPEITVWNDKCRITTGKNGKPACYDDFRVTEFDVFDGQVSLLTIWNMSMKGLVVYGKATEKAQKSSDGQETAKPVQEPEKNQKSRFERALALKEEALELGITADGINGWIAATIGAKNMREYTDAEVTMLEAYLATLVSDKKELLSKADADE